MNDGNRFTWWLWRRLIRLPGICTVNAHSMLIWRVRRDPRIDWMCRDDMARTGACYCGKLTRPGGVS